MGPMGPTRATTVRKSPAILFRLAILLALATLLGTPTLAQPSAAPELFVDVSAQAGIATPHGGIWSKYLGRTISRGYISTGQAWGDYDNDGWVDLYLAGGTNPSTLYHNNSDGTFTVSEFSNQVALPDTWTGGAVWADYDNDGFKDLYVLANGANVLFHNEQGQGFIDVTEAAGVGDTGKGTTATWGDYDGDGHLDLFVANWSCFPECRPIELDLASDRLYRSLGDGTFEDASGLLEAARLQGAAFAASFVDYDDDGDPDIYVVNDMAQNPIGNVLWRNDGPGCTGWCWRDVSGETNTRIVAGGMGLAVGDFDNDLDLDLNFSDMAEPTPPALPVALLENLGEGFRNVSLPAGVGGPLGTVGWGTVFFDFNNDGWLDLFLAATKLTKDLDFQSAPVGMLFPSPNLLFENDGDGTFHSVLLPSWQQQPKPSLGAAYADYDHDGLIDLVVGNFGVGYSLYRNTSPVGAGNHWLTVRLEGRAPVNRDAIGSRVYVTTPDGMTRMQEVKSGSSLGAGNDTALHFGLAGSEIASVRVVWPDGTEVAFEEVAADRIWHLVHGHTKASE